MNKSTTGWIVAAVLAVVLGGALIFQVAGGRTVPTAAIGGGNNQGQGPPEDVAEDAQKIKVAKESHGDRNTFSRVPPGQEASKVEARPENACDPELPPNVFAEWRNVARNLNEANGRASQIYVATVQDVAPGQELQAEAPTEEGGQVETPTQRVTLKIDERVKGRGPDRGETVTIESLGDGDRGCYRVEGDPAYQRGEQYLLFLEEGRGGRPAHTFAPEGRFRVRDGALVAVQDNDRMSDVARQRLADVLARLRSG